MSIPSNIIYYAFYEQFKKFFFNKIPSNSKLYSIYPLICGGLARCIEVPLLTPLEIIRIRQQATLNQNFVNTFLTCWNESKKRGLKIFYRGLTSTLIRDVPFSAIYWQIYENLVFFISRTLKFDRNTMKCTILSGGISGSICTLITTPLDVIKTIQQVNTSESISILKVMKYIYHNEGFTGLFKGAIPRMIKAVPACAIMISCYEAGKRYFGHKLANKKVIKDFIIY